MEEAIRCTVATLQLLEPLHWVWRDGERSEEEVAAALRIQEEARRRAARRLEAWRLEAAREWEHARQRGLWFRHWEGVEGRRMARMDAESRRVDGGEEKGCSGGAEAEGEAFEAEEDLATEEWKNAPHPLPLPCHPSPLLLCSACRNKDHFGLGRGSVLLEVSWSFLRYVPRNYRLNLKGKNASQDTIPEFPTNDAKP